MALTRFPSHSQLVSPRLLHYMTTNLGLLRILRLRRARGSRSSITRKSCHVRLLGDSWWCTWWSTFLKHIIAQHEIRAARPVFKAVRRPFIISSRCSLSWVLDDTSWRQEMNVVYVSTQTDSISDSESSSWFQRQKYIIQYGNTHLLYVFPIHYVDRHRPRHHYSFIRC